jgi:Glycosyltransferase family 87
LLPAQAAASLFFLLLIGSALAAPNIRSDFHTSFYIAGYLVNHAQVSELYPRAQAATYVGLPFDLLAHRLLPDIPANLMAVFMYCPTVALLFAPLSLLPPDLGLLSWQLLSISALALSGKLSENTSGCNRQKFFWFSLLFVPVFATIWIGQLGLVLALLPLCLAHYLLTKNRSFAAGLCCSVLILKPQLMPIALLVAGALAMRKQYRCAVGLVVGVMSWLSLTIAVFGLPLLVQWIQSLSLAELLIGSNQFVHPNHLVASLPGSLLTLLPTSAKLLWKWPVYSLGALFGAVGLWQLWQCSRSDMTDKEFQSLAIVVAVMALPLCAPRLLIYDLCSFVLPAALVIQNSSWRGLRAAVASSLLIIEIYGIAVLFSGGKLSSSVLSLGLLACNLALWWAISKMRHGRKAAGVTTQLENTAE